MVCHVENSNGIDRSGYVCFLVVDNFDLVVDVHAEMVAK